MVNEKLPWIGFSLVKGIGAVRLQSLIDYFGHIESAWAAGDLELMASGLSPRLVERVLQVRQNVDLAHYWQTQIEAQGIQMLTWADDGYPARLKEVNQAPPILYYQGSLLGADTWAVAIVGTRKVTPYGRQVTEELASFLASRGVTVVSGLARGVDAIAHQAALNAGGRTIAVLGSGVDRIYPPENRVLAEKMVESGAVVSDYAPGTPPEGPNFPPRNRIISGLSMAVVVIEAAETSGALITAEFAAEQGREVFAVPGNIRAPQSKGTNRLIKNGAHPLLSMQDILDVLNLTRLHEHRSARQTLPADETEKKLLSTLSLEPAHIDDICKAVGLPIEQISASLTMMELKGMVRQVGGMNYVTVRESQAEYKTN